jgi:hypothetical protein
VKYSNNFLYELNKLEKVVKTVDIMNRFTNHFDAAEKQGINCLIKALISLRMI